MIHMIHYVIWIRFSQVHARIRGSFLIEICWSILHYDHLILFCILHIIIQPTCQVFEEASRKGQFAQKKYSMQLFTHLHVVANPVIILNFEETLQSFFVSEFQNDKSQK